MIKKPITKDDGRYLIYYEFKDEESKKEDNKVEKGGQKDV